MQISSPNNGGFFENEITVKGISDAGADVYVCADGAERVDVSSGVENDDKAGKNPKKIHDFVAAVKS